MEVLETLQSIIVYKQHILPLKGSYCLNAQVSKLWAATFLKTWWVEYNYANISRIIKFCFNASLIIVSSGHYTILWEQKNAHKREVVDTFAHTCALALHAFYKVSNLLLGARNSYPVIISKQVNKLSCKCESSFALLHQGSCSTWLAIISMFGSTTLSAETICHNGMSCRTYRSKIVNSVST